MVQFDRIESVSSILFFINAEYNSVTIVYIIIVAGKILREILCSLYFGNVMTRYNGEKPLNIIIYLEKRVIITEIPSTVIRFILY